MHIHIISDGVCVCENTFSLDTVRVSRHKMHPNPDVFEKFYSTFEDTEFRLFRNGVVGENVWNSPYYLSVIVAEVAKPLNVGGHLDVPGRDVVWWVHFLSLPHPGDLHSRNPGSWHSVYVAQGAGDMWGVKWLTVKFLISAICSICCLNTLIISLYP